MSDFSIGFEQAENKSEAIKKAEENIKKYCNGASDDEIVLCSATHYDDGEVHPHQYAYGVVTGFVVCGYRHHNIVNSIAHLIGKNKYNTTQGFLTSNGRFVNRKEAMLIARKHNQIIESRLSATAHANILFSEDIY